MDYGDGSPESTWTYDLAGNRASWNLSAGAYLYDNLNRLTYHPHTTCTNDLLANRTWENNGQPSAKRFVYDELNRATSICDATDGAAYEYRADGMRVEKVSGLTITWNPADDSHRSGWYDDNWSVNKATTRYFYPSLRSVPPPRSLRSRTSPYRPGVAGHSKGRARCAWRRTSCPKREAVARLR